MSANRISLYLDRAAIWKVVISPKAPYGICRHRLDSVQLIPVLETL